MSRRQGVQAEVVLSLALVMITATALLAAVVLSISQLRVESLHALLGQGFATTVRTSDLEVHPIEGGHWWRIDSRGRVSGLNASARELDVATRALGESAARTGLPHVQSGSPWIPIRFAAPDPGGRGTIVGRMDAPVPGWLLAALILVDVGVFGLCGVTLLRRRIVGPLGRLARAVRELGTGEATTPAPVEGAAEIAGLGAAFNDMQAALTARTDALEKAVRDLRRTNAELVQARAGLDRAERLALVGSLAAGVAHEVGNPMGALLGFLDVAGRDPGLGEGGRRCLARASEQGERVRVILRQLLDFSRPPRIERAAISLPELARQTADLVRTQQRYEAVAIEVDVADPIPDARGDAGLAVQILMNLTLNAADAALASEGERRVRIEVGSDVARRRAADADPNVARAQRAGEVVVCAVEDSGPGLGGLPDPERIFDPFFTTKPPGEGTGLGLANARRLAEEMDGRLELDPEGATLGGARFRLVLPAEGAPEAIRSAVRVPDGPGQSRIP